MYGDLPNKKALAVIPIVWVITMPVGVFWVSRLSIVREQYLEDDVLLSV